MVLWVFFIMRKAILVISLLASLFCFGQDEDEIARFTADSIDGVYIPRNLSDTFNQINLIWPDSTKVRMKFLTEEQFLGNLHFGFGRWMRNNWGLWGGSRLSTYFNEKGIFHPDDMSGIILTSYYRDLNKIDIRLEEQIQYYQDYWKKAQLEEQRRKDEEFSGYKIGDTVIFKYPHGFSTTTQEKKHDDDICIAKGKIIQLEKKDYLIKIKILDACDKKGIVSYDNKDVLIHDPESQSMVRPKKRVIKHLKTNQEDWFHFSDWELEE